MIIKILTLNLHTYQEVKFELFNDLQKFLSVYRPIQKHIAEFIMEKDVDIAFFQEAGQYKEETADLSLFGFELKKSNYIRIISDILNECNFPNNFVWSFTHYGFGIWEEGNGLITKHKICEVESRCLSKNCSPEDFHTRRILRATIDINGVYLDVYNVHFNWFEDGFENEFEKLLEWIEERKNEKFIIAGDFNVSSESNCYKAITESKVIGKKLIDCWLIVNADTPHEPTFVGDEQSQQSRIDYVLIPEDISCKSGYVVFKETKVSDHYGLYYELNLK